MKKEIILVGSLFFKYVVVVNVDLLNEVFFVLIRYMVEEIVFFFEVDVIYFISLNEMLWSNRYV